MAPLPSIESATCFAVTMYVNVSRLHSDQTVTKNPVPPQWMLLLNSSTDIPAVMGTVGMPINTTFFSASSLIRIERPLWAEKVSGTNRGHDEIRVGGSPSLARPCLQ